ncbi:unnamed protein product [Phytomonas sp. EM1]|nr:unnamed protein product [Phytomonas sp. EM1]|eukprot:CCW64164.1 unnamed protein product [Phytomonas sp. isolate EM1]
MNETCDTRLALFFAYRIACILVGDQYPSPLSVILRRLIWFRLRQAQRKRTESYFARGETVTPCEKITRMRGWTGSGDAPRG